MIGNISLDTRGISWSKSTFSLRQHSNLYFWSLTYNTTCVPVVLYFFFACSKYVLYLILFRKSQSRRQEAQVPSNPSTQPKKNEKKTTVILPDCTFFFFLVGILVLLQLLYLWYTNSLHLQPFYNYITHNTTCEMFNMKLKSFLL